MAGCSRREIGRKREWAVEESLERKTDRHGGGVEREEEMRIEMGTDFDKRRF